MVAIGAGAWPGDVDRALAELNRSTQRPRAKLNDDVRHEWLIAPGNHETFALSKRARRYLRRRQGSGFGSDYELAGEHRKLTGRKDPDADIAEMTSADWEAVAAPADDLPAALAGTERPGHILRALHDLEQIMAAEAEWLKNWHVHLFACLDPEDHPKDPPPSPDFAPCCQESPESGLDENPAVRDICDKLQTLRRQADRIVKAVRRTKVIPPTEYSRFMNTVLDFSTAVRQLQNDTWNRLANIDPLTGLGNRQAMLRKLRVECERQARNRQPGCVALLDFDFFKDVNDTYGHAAGDTVLRSVASLLAASIRPYDQVFRYGGEEFVVCLPNADARTAWAIVERLRLKVAGWSVPVKNDQHVRLTVSAGVAPLDVEQGVDSALDTADTALYAAKRNGRNCVYVRCAEFH